MWHPKIFPHRDCQLLSFYSTRQGKA